MKHFSSFFIKRHGAGLFCFLSLLFWLLFQASPAGAIDLTVAPSEVQPGESVQVTILLNFTIYDPPLLVPIGYAEVNYGDGNGWHNVGLGTTPDGHNYSITRDHRYAAAGTYTVRVRYQPGMHPSGAPGMQPTGPPNPSRTVTVVTFLTFTRIQVYFKNHESKLFVKRNQRDIEAAADFRYEGAGLFKGYWQADDRILAQVIKNLPYANNRTFTLKLPAVPPLPTHMTGSHRLRFVITEPAMDITFPEVIYVVAGEDLLTRHPIFMVGPLNGEVRNADSLVFSWKEKPGVSTYRIEIFAAAESHEVIFSAYSKETAYTMPDSIVSGKLSPDITYNWRVIGLDENDLPVAESVVFSFSLSSTQ